MGPLIIKEKMSVFHISLEEPCNPTSIIRLSQTEYKNTVIYTCEYLSRQTKLSHLDIK